MILEEEKSLLNSNLYENTVLLNELNRNMTTTMLPVTIFMSLEIMVGLLGNISVLLVYYRHCEKSNFRIFVMFMGSIDLTTCLTMLPGEVYTQLHWYKFEHIWLCKLKSYFNIFTVWSSALILVLLAVDRNRKVCRPLGKQLSEEQTKKLCVGSVIISAVMAFPVVLFWGQQSFKMTVDSQNITVTICEKDDKFKDTMYPFVYMVSSLFFPVITASVALLCLNFLTACSLFKHRLRHSSYSVKSVEKVCENINIFSVTDTISKRVSGFKTLGKQEVGSYADKKSETTETLKSSADGDQISAFENKLMSNDETILNVNIQADVVGIRESSSTTPNILKYLRSNSMCIFPKQNRFSVGRRSMFTRNSISESSFFSFWIEKRQDAIKRKTTIMLFLTTVFVITMATYMILITKVAAKDGILQHMGNVKKTVYFFFTRLYFINTNINPVLYGIVDPRFRLGLSKLWKRS